MAEMKVADSTGIDAKIAEMAVIESNIEELLALAEAAAEQAALVRDRYPARFYEQNVTLRSHNDLAMAGDVLVSTATGSSTWEAGGDGELQISASQGTGNAELKIDLTGELNLADSLALRANVNVDDEATDVLVTAKLLTSSDVVIWTSKMVRIATNGRSEYALVREEIPKEGVGAARLQILVNWQTNVSCLVNFVFADNSLFNDHVAQLSRLEVLLSRQVPIVKTSDFSTQPGQSASGHVGKTIHMKATGGSVECTLKGNHTEGDIIDFELTVSGVNVASFVADVGDSILAAFDETSLGTSDSDRRVRAHAFLDGSSDLEWHLSISSLT